MTDNKKDDTSGLKSLGNKTTNYQYNQPDASILECFPNKFPERPYAIKLDCPEFTSRCPKTNQPDFAEIEISYVPDKLCLETKSLKLYLFAYRDHGCFMETIVNTIYEDIYNTIVPLHLQVKGDFNVRGGIGLSVVVDSDYVNAMNNLNKNKPCDDEDDDKPMASAEFLNDLLNGKE